MQDLKQEKALSTLNKMDNQYVPFDLKKELFAISIENVREIIYVYQITPVPLVTQNIRGIINIRGTIIPIIDLKYRLYKERSQIKKTSRIIVIEMEDDNKNVLIGIIVDAAHSVINIEHDAIKGSPDFSANIRPSFISNICKVKDQFYVLLNIREMLNIDELAKIEGKNINYDKIQSKSSMEASQIDISAEKKKLEEEEEIEANKKPLIIFLIGDELYGLEMEKVKEIISVSKITEVPNTMPYMKGIMDLRDILIPIIDMRLRCGLAEKAYIKQTAILIVHFKEKLIGLAVDSVVNVEKIPINSIQETFHYSAQIDNDFIRAMCKNNEKLIIIIDEEKILSSEDVKILEKIKPDKTKKTIADKKGADTELKNIKGKKEKK